MLLLLSAWAAGGGAGEHPAADEAASPGVDLTREERDWLAAHPVLRVGVDPDFAPYGFIDGSGRYSGIGELYVRILSQRLGIDLRVEPGLSWQQVVEKARNRELDMVAAVAKTPARSQFLDFTRAYVKFPFVIVTRRDYPALKGVSDLSGKRVALVNGYAATDLTLLHNPELEPLYVDTTEESLRAVAFGRADAAVGGLASLDYVMQEDILANLKVAAETEFQVNGLRMGVRNDLPILAAILDKALATVTVEEHRAILRHWIGSPSAVELEMEARVELTDAEWEWIRKHPEVVLAISSQWAPAVMRAADGSLEGMMPDLLQLLNKRLGTNIRLEAGMWKEMVEKAKRGELDGLAASVAGPARTGHFNFTSPYVHVHNYIFVRSDSPPIAALEDLRGRRVAYTGATSSIFRI